MFQKFKQPSWPAQPLNSSFSHAPAGGIRVLEEGRRAFCIYVNVMSQHDDLSFEVRSQICVYPSRVLADLVRCISIL